MENITIKPERVERLLSDEFHLRSGKGIGINGGVDACIMQAVDWLAGGDGSTDSPECASPMITRFCIRLNDSALFAKHRDLLKPFAIKIVGTRNKNLEQKRAFIAADYAVRVFAPICLRADPQHRFDEHAAAMEGCSPIIDKATSEAANLVGKKARDAAAAAAAAVAAAAAAAAAAAVAAAYADAYAVAVAAAYADAYAVADADAAARKKVLAEYGDLLRSKTLECLQALIDVK